MFSSIISGAIAGLQCYITRVETDLSRALPGFDMVGHLSREVTEARERVKVALRNCGIELPPVHITVNLSPADIPKSGTAFDLPIAIGILVALGYIHEDKVRDTCILGELGLNGQVCSVRGVLPIVMQARSYGCTQCIVPLDNACEAAFINDIEVIGVSSFTEALDALTSPDYIPAKPVLSPTSGLDKCEDFSDVIGQDSCKRAALISAAGFHHLLITGSPGSGKTMIARRLPSILPPLTTEESIEVSSIYSIAGKLTPERPFLNTRPFQSPHHSTTLHSLIGGGHHIRPGALSLSHRGVLFLDELPEFKKECIEALREPLEEHRLQVTRVHGTYNLPTDFLLVAASNPCPCGYYPDRNRCSCSDSSIQKYQNRISGPIRDRIDLTVSATPIDIGHLTGKSPSLSSASMRAMVLKSHALQASRYSDTNYSYNSQLNPGDIERYIPLGKEEKKYISEVFNHMNLSARAYHKTLKVARTIADLDESKDVHIPHIAEAVCYRNTQL